MRILLLQVSHENIIITSEINMNLLKEQSSPQWNSGRIVPDEMNQTGKFRLSWVKAKTLMLLV